MRATPTAPVAGATLILGYAVAASTGSRPLGGVVLLVGGLGCIETWRQRHGPRTAGTLACAGIGALVLSHVLALAIGAWPSVLLVAFALATAVWSRADSPATRSGRSTPLRKRRDPAPTAGDMAVEVLERNPDRARHREVGNRP